MFGGNKSGVRGRNVENVQEWEEKGLLSRRMSRPGSTDGYELEGKEKGQATFEASPGPEEGGAGLSSKRDREAFALLVVLCKSPGVSLVAFAHSCRPVTGHSARPDIRHTAIPPQSAPIILSTGRVCARNVAVLAQTALVPDRRCQIRSEVGQAEELDRACPGNRRRWALDYRREGRELARGSKYSFVAA